MLFDFDLKFAFTASPAAIIFEKQDERCQYTLKN